MKISLRDKTLRFAERGRELGGYKTVTAFVEAAVFESYQQLVEKQQLSHGIWQKKQPAKKKPPAITPENPRPDDGELDLNQLIVDRLESMVRED